MTEGLSPAVRKLLAIALLVTALWIVGGVLGDGILGRLQASREIADLRERAASLESRRYAAHALEQRLAEISQAIVRDQLAILTQNDRSAFAALQSSVRSAIQATGGTLTSLAEIKGHTHEAKIGLQFRARIGEPGVKPLVERLESGEPRLEVHDLALASKSPTPGKQDEIEISATVTALWLDPRGLPR